MQVEIKSVTTGNSKFGEYKCVELANGTKYFVGADKPPYKFINVGYVGVAEIETAKSKNNKNYIKIFKPAGKGKPTQTAQKPHQQANKPINGAFKKDPAGIALEYWKRRHTSWIGCLQCAVKRLVGQEAVDNEEIIKLTNEFYNALCEKVDKKKEVNQEQEYPTDYEQAEVVESDIDTPF